MGLVLKIPGLGSKCRTRVILSYTYLCKIKASRKKALKDLVALVLNTNQAINIFNYNLDFKASSKFSELVL